MIRLAFFLLTAVLWLASAGCQTCKKLAGDGGAAAAATAPAPPPAWRALVELLPAGMHWGVIAGDGAKLLEGSRALLTRMRGTTLGMLAEEMVRLAQHKMGLAEVEPFDPAVWRARGIEPARGAALVAMDANRGAILFAVADPAKAEALVQLVLRKLEVTATFQKAGSLTLVHAKGKSKAMYGFHAGYGIVAGPVASEAEARQFFDHFAQPNARRLIHAPAYAALGSRSDFGRGATLLILPEALQVLDPPVRDLFGPFRGLALRIEPSEGGAALDAFVATTPQYALSVQRILPGGGAGAGLARFLGEDTLLAASGRVDLGALLKALISMAPEFEKIYLAALDRLKRKLDIDVEKEFFQNLTGDGSLGIHKVDAAVFPVIFAGGGIRRIFATDPFHLSLLLKVRDPVVASKFLRKIAILADLPTEKEGAIEVFPLPFARMDADAAAPKAGPALRFALVGDTLVMTTGRGRMQKTLAAIQTKSAGFLPKVLDADTRKQLEAAATPVAYVHGSNVTENLREIESAFLRKGKLLFSNIVQKVTEVVDRFADVSLGGEAHPDGQRFWLRLRLR